MKGGYHTKGLTAKNGRREKVPVLFVIKCFNVLRFQIATSFRCEAVCVQDAYAEVRRFEAKTEESFAKSGFDVTRPQLPDLRDVPYLHMQLMDPKVSCHVSTLGGVSFRAGPTFVQNSRILETKTYAVGVYSHF